MDGSNRARSRVERLRRVEAMLLAAGDRGMRATELARRLGAVRQTVHRDLVTLQDSGVPLWCPGRGLWAVRQERYVGTVRLDIHEAVVLFFAARLLTRTADEHNPHAVSALEKLAARFPEPVRTQAMQAARLLEQHPDSPEFVRALEALTLGWVQRRKVRFQYRAAKGHQAHPYVLHPYVLEPVGPSQAAYVLGYEESYFGQVVTLKIERMSGAELLAEGFEEPAGFDAVAALRTAWGIMWSTQPVTVRLRFTKEVTRRVKESHWHPSQRIQETPDGGCILTLEVGHTLELKPWIRSWGATCEVLEPVELRREVAQDAWAAAALYGPEIVREDASTAGSAPSAANGLSLPDSAAAGGVAAP